MRKIGIVGPLRDVLCSLGRANLIRYIRAGNVIFVLVTKLLLLHLDTCYFTNDFELMNTLNRSLYLAISNIGLI